MKKLEEALLQNLSLISLIFPSVDISLEDPVTSTVYRLLKANEWIAINYERLCNNEAIECEVTI